MTPTLFDYIPPPHARGSTTSAAAADSITDVAGSLRARVLGHIAGTGGSTCDEIEAALDLRHQTASARVRELALLGRVRDAGGRRRTRSGRQAVVWVEVAP